MARAKNPASIRPLVRRNPKASCAALREHRRMKIVTSQAAVRQSMSKRLAYVLRQLGHRDDDPKPQVGLTGKPKAETRCRQRKNEGYELMFVFGRIRGRALAVYAEQHLIAKYRPELGNVGPGGEGIKGGTSWWLYVALKGDDLPDTLAGRDLLQPR